MYKFINTEYKEALEGRYFCANGFSLAIVASITKRIGWSAYIGADQSREKEDTLQFVLEQGCKLREEDARHFFPNIDLPYRN